MESGKKIIVVADDEPNILSALKEILSETYFVYTAIDGLQALKLAREVRPDIMLLDVVMPGMGGIEACGILKNDAKTKNIPVIFLTAKAQTDDVEKGFAAGADAYVAKPFSAEKLMKKVESVIATAEIRKGL
jgi:putative two-component system response regulator